MQGQTDKTAQIIVLSDFGGFVRTMQSDFVGMGVGKCKGFEVFSSCKVSFSCVETELICFVYKYCICRM